MTATATLVHTSSRTDDNALRIARVAAAGRIERARIAAEYRATVQRAKAEAVAGTYVRDLIAAGAVEVGFKICDDMGKWRGRVVVGNAAPLLAAHWGEDVEAWGIDANGEYVGQPW